MLSFTTVVQRRFRLSAYMLSLTTVVYRRVSDQVLKCFYSIKIYSFYSIKLNFGVFDHGFMCQKIFLNFFHH